jgi:hypothetical protein
MSSIGNKSLWHRAAIRIGCVLFLLVLCGACPFIYLDQREIHEWFVALRTSSGIPAVQGRYRSIRDNILSIRTDNMLQENVEEIHVKDNYPGCLVGGLSRVYGTSSTFDEIISAYSGSSVLRGWRFVELREGMKFYANSDGTAEVRISVINMDESSQEEWRQYKTVYRLGLYYSEPKITWCEG